MSISYSTLLSELPKTCAEKPHNYHFLTERHIQAMWMEQKYFTPLTTSNGDLIKVVSPGIWNAEAGPDFLKAHLEIGSEIYFGDVEIHLNDENWTHHRHHLDSRYNHVILHLSLWLPNREKEVITENGKTLTRAYLENSLTIPPSRIVQLIDLDLYPYRKFIGSGQCAQALFRSLPEKEIETLFQSAAKWRLRQKYTHLQARAEDILTAGIAMALGYKQNTEAFLDLYLWLRSLQNQDAEKILALGMGACGFFKDSFHGKWGESKYFHTLATLFTSNSEKKPKISLRLNQIRPLNHPIRRLVLLVKLLTDCSLPTLPTRMLAYWESSWKNRNWSEMREHFKTMLPTYQDPYWNHHYTFESEARDKFLPLMGNSLKDKILVNTLLPLLYEEVLKRNDPQETAAFEKFYLSLNGSKNGKTKYLVHRFFGDSPKGTLLNKGMMEQGAYQLHRDFCLHFEASCQGCPFVAKYRNL